MDIQPAPDSWFTSKIHKEPWHRPKQWGPHHRPRLDVGMGCCLVCRRVIRVPCLACFPRQTQVEGTNEAGAYLPSKKEIAAETARIREGWSDEEYEVRAGFFRTPFPWPEMPDDTGQW